MNLGNLWRAPVFGALLTLSAASQATAEGTFDKQTAQASLTISNDPGLSKLFSPATIPVGGSSRLILNLFIHFAISYQSYFGSVTIKVLI